MRGYGFVSCLKCGKDTQHSQVFCDECLEVMQQYPVEPDVAIQIPRRSARNQEQVHDSQELAAEKELRRMRRMVRWLVAFVAILSILLLVCTGLLFQDVSGNTPVSNIGKNYNTIDPAGTP